MIKFKSYSRTEFISKILGILKNEKVLDLGCRDGVLKKNLKGDFKYNGIDLNPVEKDVNIYNHDLQNGLPKNLENIDIIFAIDVLEHIDNPLEILFEMMENSNKLIILALPNMAYYKFRLKFLLKGELSLKYPFGVKNTHDRHKWITNLENIKKFVNHVDKKKWKINDYNFIFQRKRNFLFFYLEKFLSIFFPNLFVYEKIFFLKKL